MVTLPGYRGLLIPATGDIRPIILCPRDDYGAADTRRHIGCELIEHLRGPDCSLWVDQLAATTDPPRPENERATRLLTRLDGWPIRGDVVITGPVQRDGGLRQLVARDLGRLLGAMHDPVLSIPEAAANAPASERLDVGS